MTDTDDMSRKVGEAIIGELTRRRGLRQAFDEIDPDIQEELRDTLGYLAINAISGEAKGAFWLAEALRPFVLAYKSAADPVGDSDLYDEQPRSVSVKLGDCRRAAIALATSAADAPATTEG